MQPDDHVCLCFHVSLRKLRAFMRSEDPKVASQLSECMGAGTGCHWCVPFLEELYRQWENGEEPDLPFDPETYATERKSFHKTGERGLKAGDRE
jgi:bacterioferritin-associated ferredoxin